MAIVLSGVNNNDRISASDGTLDLISGVTYSGEVASPSFKVGNNIQLGNAGIVTATTFVGNVTGNINNSILLLQTGGTERIRIDSAGLVTVDHPSAHTASSASPARLSLGGSFSNTTAITTKPKLTLWENDSNNDAMGFQITGNLLSVHLSKTDYDFAIKAAGNTILQVDSGNNETNFSTNHDLNINASTNKSGVIRFNTYAPTAAGPNKIILWENANWSGGFGVSVDHIDYYSGHTHCFYTGTTTSSVGKIAAEYKKDGAVELYHNGTKRFETTSNGILINGAANLESSGSNITVGGLGINETIFHRGDENTAMDFTTDTISFRTAGANRLRIDSSGRLLVGTTSTSSSVRAVFQGYHGGGDDYQARVQFQTNQATNLSTNQHLANLLFTNSSGSVGAEIRAIADAAWGTNDYPGRLEFYTTPDGSNTSTERLRITSAGNIGVNLTTPITTKGIHISKGGAGQAVNTYSVANEYMHFGHTEYNNAGDKGLYLLGFGYVGSSATNSPAYMGFNETSTGSFTYGDLVFATRGSYNNSPPTQRIRIKHNGAIDIQSGSYITGSIAINASTAQLTNGVQISKGGGSGGVSNTYSVANEYLHLGAGEYNGAGGGSGLFAIGFGYINGSSNAPAYLGFKEESTSQRTRGSLVFATRNDVNDTEPTERFRIGSAGQLGVGSTSYYGQAGDCLVSGGSNVGVAYTAIPNIFDTSNQPIADFGKMKIKFKTVAVSGTGNVHLGLCRGGVPGNCPAGEIGIPIGFIPGVQYNANFSVGDISVTPWPSGSNRYVYYVNITSFSVAGDLGIFYLGQD